MPLLIITRSKVAGENVLLVTKCSIRKASPQITWAGVPSSWVLAISHCTTYCGYIGNSETFLEQGMWWKTGQGWDKGSDALGMDKQPKCCARLMGVHCTTWSSQGRGAGLWTPVSVELYSGGEERYRPVPLLAITAARLPFLELIKGGLHPGKLSANPPNAILQRQQRERSILCRSGLLHLFLKVMLLLLTPL